MSQLKILFANGRTCPPFNVGGDGVSLHTWLSCLTKEGCTCQAMGVLDPIHFPKKEKDLVEKLSCLKIPFQWKSKPSHQLHYQTDYQLTLVKRRHFVGELMRLIDSFQPDILLTQLELSPKVLEIGQKRSLPVIFFIHDAEKENFLTINKIDSTKSTVFVVFNSHFTQSKYKDFLPVPHKIFYPPVEPRDYFVSSNIQRFITMINPVKEKGGLIFQQIVSRLKDKRFLAVQGWCDPKTVGINLDKYANVVFWPKQDDMRKVYGQTKILLVPSTWKEGFGRVVPEAAVSGIPSITSQIGGLPEAVGDGGILIKNYQSVNEWVEKIRLLDKNEKYYQRFSSKAKQHAKKFNCQEATEKLLSIIKKIVAKHKKYYV